MQGFTIGEGSFTNRLWVSPLECWVSPLVPLQYEVSPFWGCKVWAFYPWVSALTCDISPLGCKVFIWCAKFHSWHMRFTIRVQRLTLGVQLLTLRVHGLTLGVQRLTWVFQPPESTHVLSKNPDAVSSQQEENDIAKGRCLCVQSLILSHCI